MSVQNPILETIDKTRDIAKNNTLPKHMISADSHVTEPAHCYTKYIDPKFRDKAPQVIRKDDGGDYYLIEGIPGTVPAGIIAAAGKDPKDIKYGGVPFEELHRGGYDGKARTLEQDRDGISAEIIYPSVGMILCNHADPDYKHATMWAYNRWLQEEFCAAAPHRLIGLGQTAVRSVEETIKEFEQFKAMGFKGVMMPGNPSTEFDYDDPRFDPVWQASIDLGLPVSFHILTSKSDGSNSIEAATDVRNKPKNVPSKARQNPGVLLNSIQSIIAMFIMGRVFERNPKLKVICVEADAGWAPHFAYRMDHGYKRHRFWLKLGDMQKLPSEYFNENIYLTFQDDWVAFRVAHLMNPRRLMWANDFPHSDSTWPWSQDLLLGQTQHLTEEQKNWILRDNCAEVYGLKLPH